MERESLGGSKSCVVFSKETATHLLVSACLKSPYVNSSKNREDTVSVSQETEILNVLITCFVDDLKVYQESHKILKDVNVMIVQASNDAGACYGVAKCVEIILKGENW